MTAIKVDLANIQRTTMYTRRQFVGRRNELSLVDKEINNLRTDNVQSRPILNFWAVQGSGKSWLLRHIAQQYTLTGRSLDDKPALPLLYEFSDFAQGNGQLMQNVTRQLGQAALDQLPEGVDHTELDKAVKSGNPVTLANALIALTKTFVLILLLDSVEKIPAGKWLEIERHILEPVLITRKALLVVSGRRQMPPWRNFELRRRVMDTGRTYLHPFGDREVEAQIERLDPKLPFAVRQIRPYTANSPLLVRALIQTYQKRQTEKPQKWLRPFRRQAIDQLLHNVNPDVIDVLKAVSTLRFYRLDSVNHMLSRKKSVSNADRYYFRLLQSLEPETDLAWWDSNRRAYVTSQIIRSLLNEQQKEDDLEAFSAEHKQAVQMYREFAHEFPAGSEEYLVEMLYHLGCIYQVDKELGPVNEGAREILTLAKSHLNTNHQWTLHKQIENDRDLQYMLPKPIWEQVERELGESLESDHA